LRRRIRNIKAYAKKKGNGVSFLLWILLLSPWLLDVLRVGSSRFEVLPRPPRQEDRMLKIDKKLRVLVPGVLRELRLNGYQGEG